MEQGDTGRVGHTARRVDSLGLADNGHIARRVDVALDGGAVGDEDIAVEDCRSVAAGKVAVGVGVGKEVVVALGIEQAVVAAVETVAGAEDGVVDRAAVDVDIGLGKVARGRHTGMAIRADAAHNVGAAIDDTDIAVGNLDVGVVDRTGALSAAIEGVDQYVGTVDEDVGAARCASTVIGGIGRRYAFTRIVVGISFCCCCQHHALVAAAIDIVDTALGEVECGQARHIGSVVAAEEAADVEDAAGGAVGIGCGVGIGRIAQSVERRGDVDVDLGAAHVGAVAAAEEGVDLAAIDDDVDILARHLVAAAEEEADGMRIGPSSPG